MRKMISILVRNHPGVLSHVAGLFTRRAYNIESIAAGVTETPEVTRITIVVTGDEVILEQVTKQLRKLIDVIKVQDLKYSESITRELVLMTIFVPREKRQEVLTTANTFQATVVDISEKTMTLEFVGNERKINTVIQALSVFKVKDMARTGFVALPLESGTEREHALI
ncbi:MAG: acetolactate synthase small subunit [Pseudomonadota bacterium]